MSELSDFVSKYDLQDIKLEIKNNGPMSIRIAEILEGYRRKNIIYDYKQNNSNISITITQIQPSSRRGYEIYFMYRETRL